MLAAALQTMPGVKSVGIMCRNHRPVVGDLTLGFEAMELSADTGLTLTAYTAEPGSASEDALKLLASWAATHDQANQAATTRPTGLASP